MEAIAAINTSWAWLRTSDLIAENKIEEAMEIIDAQHQFAPWELRWPLRKVELLRGEKDFDAAQDLLDKLIAQRPGNRSEEHTSELQSRPHLVCRLLLEKKKERAIGPDRHAPRRRRADRPPRLARAPPALVDGPTA